jgi:hypothetical protein
MTRSSLSAAAMVGLVGMLSAASLPAADAAAGVAASPSASCASFAAHHFVEAVSAKNHGKLTRVKAHPARFICGGPDDGHYKVNAKKVIRLTLHPSTTVDVLKSADGTSHRVIAASRLPHQLRHDTSERIFRVTGHRAHVRKLFEEFHP